MERWLRRGGRAEPVRGVPPFRVVKHLSRRFGTFTHLSAPLQRPQPTWSDPRTARIIPGFAHIFTRSLAMVVTM